MGRLGTLATIIGFIAMLGLVGAVTLGVLGELGLVNEAHPWFNCHVNGNLVCGPEAPWHGFVNLP